MDHPECARQYDNASSWPVLKETVQPLVIVTNHVLLHLILSHAKNKIYFFSFCRGGHDKISL